VGALVTINGSGLTGATSVTVGGVDDPAFSVSSDMKITAHVPNGATSGLISVTGPGGTATTPFTVTVPPKPVVTGLSPSNGPVGSVVNIVGTGLSGATAVSFNGVASTSISATTDTTVSAVVPTGATTGLVTVTTPYGWSASPTAFTVTAPLPPPPPPAITGWSPGSGPAGTSVTLNGTGFTGATSVTFNGKSATFQVGATGTTITTVVPTGATTGTISVYSPSGVGTSSAPFTVTTANPVPVTPTISSFTPTSGNSGTTVTVIGTNFTGTTAVNVKGTPARSFTVVSSTQINFVVGTGTKTGPVQVITGGGIATSKSNFSIKGKAL
jgi:hypothetical protein